MCEINKCIHPKTYKNLALQVGVFFALAFTLCFLWYWVRGGGVALEDYHLNGLKIAFFGFTGMNFASFIAGLAQSFIWGLIAVGLWMIAAQVCGFKGRKCESHSGAESEKCH